MVSQEDQPLWKVVGHLAILHENGQSPVIIFNSEVYCVSQFGVFLWLCLTTSEYCTGYVPLIIELLAVVLC